MKTLDKLRLKILNERVSNINSWFVDIQQQLRWLTIELEKGYFVEKKKYRKANKKRSLA